MCIRLLVGLYLLLKSHKVYEFHIIIPSTIGVLNNLACIYLCLYIIFYMTCTRSLVPHSSISGRAPFILLTMCPTHFQLTMYVPKSYNYSLFALCHWPWLTYIMRLISYPVYKDPVRTSINKIIDLHLIYRLLTVTHTCFKLILFLFDRVE